MGCISAGSTIDELVAMAHEALQFHIDGMAEDGEALPKEPMSFEAAKSHEFADDARHFIVIYAAYPPHKESPATP